MESIQKSGKFMAEIIGYVASLVGPTIEVVKCVAKGVKRQFTYLCFFDNNIQSLRDETKNLEDARKALQRQVDAAKRNAQEIFPQVETWLTRSDEKMDIIKRIEKDIPSVQQRCMNQVKRYSISRIAKKTADSLRKFRSTGHFEQISQDALPASMVPLPNFGEMSEFESRKKIEEDLMKAPRDTKVNKIGICGMSGVGKTTMAKRIMNRVKEENLFVNVVFVAVGQQVDQYKIQCEIAELLGLELKKECVSARAHDLRRRLSEMSSLIVVDDIWEELKLYDLGIPCESNEVKCKVLLTSQDRNVLDIMGTDIFGVEILSETEAWFLFRERVGDCVDKPDLHYVAKNVAKECKCLPVALVTVGGALKNKTNMSIWDDALEQLRRCRPLHITKVIENVYSPIKFSHDNLETKPVKVLLLLCSLFAEDSNINLDILTWYGMGLCLFEGTKKFHGARNRTHTLIEILKSRSLLLDGVNEGYVKMHDIVRDTTRYIALEENFMTTYEDSMDNCSMTKNHFKDCTCISMILGSPMHGQFLEGLQSSNLRLLLMQKGKKFSFDKPMDIADSFFDGMKEINTLSLEDIWIKSLPPSTQLLKNLQTLRLSNCRVSESIVVVSELSKLEIFNCINCQELEALPIEFKKLNCLKVLEIVGCKRLKDIAPGVISSFACLEELILKDSFDGWEGKQNGGNTNAALEELESLSNLTHLEIDIKNYHLVSEKITLPPTIVKYDIEISTSMGVRGNYKQTSPQRLKVLVPDKVNIDNWVFQLLRSSKDLVLSGDGSEKVNISKLEHIKNLQFINCGLVKNLISATDYPKGFAFLPLLETLYLYDLWNLEEIFDTKALGGKSVNISLQNLTEIWIERCHTLLYLFPMSVARSLVQLEKLRLKNCVAMEGIIICDNDEMVNGKSSGELVHLSFPKLKGLYLNKLPSLKTNCKGIRSIKFPRITEIQIEECCTLRYLFPVSVARSLMQLQILQLKNCKAVEGIIISDSDEIVESKSSDELVCLSFPKFKKLSLIELPRLTTIFRGVQSIELPKIIKIRIARCRILCYLFPVSVARSFIQLRELRVENCEAMKCVIICDSDEMVEGKSSDEIVEEKSSDELVRLSFPKLKKLCLIGLRRLKTICRGIRSIDFPEITKIQIEECCTLRYLFLVSVARSLMQLEILQLKNCEAMEGVIICDSGEIVEGKGSDELVRLSFPMLKELSLTGLPSLTTICSGIQSIEFPEITKIWIEKCCTLRYLFPVSVAKSLMQLERLLLKNCEAMEGVIICDNDEIVEGKSIDELVRLSFPKLKKLSLTGLPRLTTICRGI